MKKLICLSLFTFTLAFAVMAQPDKAAVKKHGESYAFNLGVDVPIRSFKTTHDLGFGFDYSWSDQRFGKLDAKPSSPVGFTFNFGAAHYLGADDGHGGNFASYNSVHTYAGLIVNPCKSASVSLTAGPNLGLYSEQSKFGFGGKLDVSYYFTKHFAVAPGFLYIKELKVEARYAIIGRAIFAF